jgi:hypothetical protein
MPIQIVVNQEAGKGANGLGVAAVVLGVLAILVCWVPLLNLLVIPLVFFGVLLALIGLVVALVNRKSGPGWPITGIGLNAFAFVVMIVVNAAVGSAISTAAREAEAKAEAERARATVRFPADPVVEAPAARIEPPSIPGDDHAPAPPTASPTSLHRRGDRLVVMDPGGGDVFSCSDERAFRALVDAKDLEASLEKIRDKLVFFRAYSSESPVVQGAEFLEDAPPGLARVRIITGPDRGKVVFLLSRCLLTPLESARLIGEIEEKDTAIGRAKREDGEGAPAKFPIGCHVTLARPGGSGHAHVSVDREAFEQNLAAVAAFDMTTFSRLSDEGRVLRIMNGTNARVIEVKGDSRKVRLLDGYKAGSEGWVEERYVVVVAKSAPEKAREQIDRINAEREEYLRRAAFDKVVADAKREREAKEKAASAKALAARPVTLLAIGKNLQADGNARAALENYRKVVADFPGTPQAKEAAGRIKALEGK